METEILITTSLISLVSLGVACTCFYLQSKTRNLLEFAYKQIVELESSLERSKESLEAGAKTISDHSRRVAWLETRIRQPKLAKKEILEDEQFAENPAGNPASGITERRHRVLSLANSGQNAETISEMLGMLPGEVQLMINLSRASFVELA